MDNQNTSGIGPTVASRPGKLMIVGLVGVVIAFFAIILMAENGDGDTKAPQSAVTAPQSK